MDENNFEKQFDQVKTLLRLGPDDTFQQLIEDLSRPESDATKEQRRKRARVIFEFIHSFVIAEHSRQMRTATWVIAIATAINLAVALVRICAISK